MENQQNYNKARRLSILFAAVVVVLVAAMMVGILASPYDSGVLAGASLSGNNQYGGKISQSNDYLFYVQNRQVIQYNKDTGATKSIYEGEVSHLNPYDGWLYFVEDGTIQRIAYYGGEKTRMGKAETVTLMSVNGLWIYYLQADGNIGKLRSDGKEERIITDGSIKFTAFESDNRILLATDGKDIYRMKTDGADLSVLVKGSQISRMVYTLDNLYYCDNGQVKEIRSVEAKQDDGTTYGGLTASVFTYDVDSENRGRIYYMKDNELRMKKLQTVKHDKEEDLYVATLADVTALYSIDSDVYYHDAQGSLHHVYISEEDGKIQTEVEVVK